MSGRRIALVAVLCLSSCAFAQTAHAGPYSSHSQINSCCTSPEGKDALFRAAKGSGAAYIRVAINVPAIFAPDRYGPHHGLLGLILNPKPTATGPDWSGMDDVARLSRLYRLPVLGTLIGSSEPAASCPASVNAVGSCPPADSRRWASQVAQVAARYRSVIDHYEVWNEPDSHTAFGDAPGSYAHLLTDSYGSIKAKDAHARVLLGGSLYPATRGSAWLSRVFGTRGVRAAAAFDIGSIHLRGNVSDMVVNMRRRAAFYRSWGRRVPMWITEHGYPGDKHWQIDPFYRGGEVQQARYLSESLPTLALAGASQVFVTLRDFGPGPFESEGIVRGNGTRASPFQLKPAWAAVRSAALHWPVGHFKRKYVRARGQARGLHRRRYRVTVSGRFRGPRCRGRMRLAFTLPGRPVVTRGAVLRRGCRYRRTVSLSARSRRRSVRVFQRFLGNGKVGPGNARTLRLRIRR